MKSQQVKQIDRRRRPPQRRPQIPTKSERVMEIECWSVQSA
jgi:hypothetical protein